ncbi:MAG: hypothetical protein WCQ16_02850 [Verrucomicrobiae bacterium]
MSEITLEDVERARDRQRTINAYHRVFSGEDGQRVMADLKSAFGFSAPVFVAREGGGFDTHHAAVRDGQRQVLLHVDAIMEEEARGDANVEEPQVTVQTE